MMSTAQIVIVGGVLFILYRFLLKTIGVEQLGVWSLILAMTSVTQIANLGLSGSIVKYVAKYVARRDTASVSRVIQTAAISAALFVGMVLLIGYPFIRWIISLVVPDKYISLAISILPYALLAFWIMIITSIFQSGLDGLHRIDLRCLLLMLGAIIQLLLSFILTPIYGLMGLAYSNIIKNLLILICSWVLLRRYFPSLPLFPYKWDKSLFKEIIGYGISFQVISITTMLYDPITKALLSKFGGLSMVGYFEMASKMIQQLRALLVSANQVLVPAIADLYEKIPEKIQSIYISSYRLLFFLALPLYSIIIILNPTISKIWIGHQENIFILFSALLSIGWFINTLNAPAYFAFLGIGNLRWNVIGHVSIGLLNVGLGLLFGFLFDGAGVVVAWTISLILGSSVINLSYHIKNKIQLSELLPLDKNKLIILTCLSSILFSLFIGRIISNTRLINIMVTSLPIIILICFWLHPMRKKLFGWVLDEVLNYKASA